jgi:tetratricopeptide (TPR) repeat protein
VVAAAVIGRRSGVVTSRRALLIFGLGIVGGLEAHGLTDQVVTTNVGTLLLVLGLACVLAGLTDDGLVRLDRFTRQIALALATLILAIAVGFVVLPNGRAQALLNLGGLEMNQALALPPQSSERGAALAQAESTLSVALGQDGGHPAVLRDLAWVRAAQFDDSGGLMALQASAGSPRIDTFDVLQIAHAYRDLGEVEEAYAWAARAYAEWGRAPEDEVMQVYAQSTLTDSRARTLATQAEAAMLARHFSEAHALFEQALTFEADNQYLQDRIGASQRAVDKYGG